jgi:hypothetical protein
MKKIIQLLLLSGLTLGLTGCDPFEGLLKVKKTFTVVDNKNSTYQIPVGDQNAKLDFLSRDRVRITTDINGKKEKITMNLPKNLNVPDNGEFVVTAAELGQSFSIRGGIATHRTDSQTYRGYEQCQYTRYDVICNIVNNQQVCHQEPRTVYGQQPTEYFNRTTAQKIKVNFIGSVLLAIFDGAKSVSEKIYTYKGQCF